MKSIIYWVIAVMSLSTAFAQSQASTFQDPAIDELYTEYNQPELYCLAQNIYFEAKSEPLAGQDAVKVAEEVMEEEKEILEKLEDEPKKKEVESSEELNEEPTDVEQWT